VQRRALVDAAAERKGLEFSAHNLEIGFRYEAGALVPEPAAEDGDPRTFRPSARPGARMPHAWVGAGVRCRSTYELVDPGRFTLFVGDDGAPWREAATQLGLDVIVIGATGLVDRDGTWQRQSAVGSDGAVLVRPDHHVAWRSAGAVADPVSALRDVLDVVLPGVKTAA
jgi:2,4-dichlorophenol 6-monooxygenase